MPQLIRCEAINEDGLPCGSLYFYGLYNCEDKNCTVREFEDQEPRNISPEPGTPDSLPGCKPCPGCMIDVKTWRFRCAQCDTVHDFSTLNNKLTNTPLKGISIVSIPDNETTAAD